MSSASLRSAPTICPTLFFGVGPTGCDALKRARRRIEGIVGGVPPFYGFVATEETPLGPRISLQVGAAPQERFVPDEEGEHASKAKDVQRNWVRRALARVTDASVNHEHTVYHGFRNDADRLFVVCVVAADEVDDFELFLSVPSLADQEYPGCFRLGTVWARTLTDDDMDDLDERKQKLSRNLEKLASAQNGVQEDGPVKRPLNAFHAYIRLEAPMPPGRSGLKRRDAGVVSGALLSYLTVTHVGPLLQKEFHPQPSPAPFYLGLAVRRHDPREIIAVLKEKWYGAIAKLLDTELSIQNQSDAWLEEETAFADSTEEENVLENEKENEKENDDDLAGPGLEVPREPLEYVPSLLPDKVGLPPSGRVASDLEAEEIADAAVNRAEGAIAEYCDAVFKDAVADAIPALSEGEATFRLTGALVRAQRILERHVKALHRTTTKWQRELERTDKDYEAWKLSSRPQVSYETYRGRVPRSWLLLLFLPAVALAMPPVVWMRPFEPWRLAWLAAAVLLPLPFVISLWYRRPKFRLLNDAARKAFDATGAWLRRRRDLALHMLSEPEPDFGTVRAADGDEPVDGGLQTEREPQVRGLHRAIRRLEELYLELLRTRQVLRSADPKIADDASWFVRNVLSPADLDSLFEEGVKRRALELCSQNPGTQRNPRSIDVSTAVAWTLREAVGSGGLKLLVSGADALLERFDGYLNELFSRYESLELRDVLEHFAHEHPGGATGHAALFNALARGASLHGTPGPMELTREQTFLVHSPPWDADVVKAGKEGIDHCRVVRAESLGELALLRLARGVAPLGETSS